MGTDLSSLVFEQCAGPAARYPIEKRRGFEDIVWTAQCPINEVLRDYIHKGEMLTYMDNLIIVAKDIFQGLSRLHNILKTSKD